MNKKTLTTLAILLTSCNLSQERTEPSQDYLHPPTTTRPYQLLPEQPTHQSDHHTYTIIQITPKIIPFMPEIPPKENTEFNTPKLKSEDIE